MDAGPSPAFLPARLAGLDKYVAVFARCGTWSGLNKPVRFTSTVEARPGDRRGLRCVARQLIRVLSIDRIRFGDFEFDRLNRLLYRDGAELALPPRAVGVLSCLIDRPGQIVPKQVLLDEVWKDANVTETSLTEAVSLLRQALVDDPQRPTFIQTVPRRGYRFVAAAQPASDAAARPVTGDNVARAPDGAACTSVMAAPGLAATEPAAAQLAATQLVAPQHAAPLATTASHGMPAKARPAVDDGEWPAWLPWMFVVVMIGVMTGIIAAVMRQPSSYARPVVRFGVELPAGVELARDGASLALSRDGRRVAFVARRTDGPGVPGAPRIYVRDADRLDPTVLEGTEGASSPFFSPDAAWIGFFAGGALKKVPSAGGAVVTLCDARAPLGAVWSTRRVIVFSSSLTGGLSRVHEDGGTPAMLTTPDADAGEVRHAWPDLLPGDAGIVFAGLPLAGGPEAARVAVLPFETGRVRTLVEAAASPHVAPTGHLLFARGHAVFAAPFDPDTLEILGQAVPVMDDVAAADGADGADGADTAGTNGVTQFAVAPAGHAAAIRLTHPEAAATYRWVRAGEAGPESDVTTAARDGGRRRPAAPAAARAAVTSTPSIPASAAMTSAAIPFPAREIRWLSISPDGTRLVFARGDGHRSEIWTSDVNGGAFQRLTSDGQNIAPVWSADGRRVIYAARQDGPFTLFAKTVGEAAAAAVAVRAVTPPLAGTAASAPSSASRSGGSAASGSSRQSASAPPVVQGAAAAAAAVGHQTFPASAAHDGLVYVDVNTGGAGPRTGLDLWFLPWSGGAPRPLVRTPADEAFGVVSPDGRWLAWQSNASGAWAAMVAARNGEAIGTARLVANTDGARLAWSPDGRALLFTRDRTLWQAPLALDGRDANTATAAGEPRLLASGVDAAGGLGVMPDGRILVRTREAAAGRTRLELVLDWSRELSAKVPITPRPARTLR